VSLWDKAKHIIIILFIFNVIMKLTVKEKTTAQIIVHQENIIFFNEIK